MAEIIQFGTVRQLDRIEGQLDNGNDNGPAIEVSVVPEPERSPEEQARLDYLAKHIEFLVEHSNAIHHIFGIAVVQDDQRNIIGYRVFNSPATGAEYAMDHRILGTYIDRMIQL